jgi:hypothetical protein
MLLLDISNFYVYYHWLLSKHIGKLFIDINIREEVCSVCLLIFKR